VKENILIFLRHGCNLPLAVAVPICLGMLDARGTLLAGMPWLALGVLIFMFMEYVTHRFALHAEPIKHPFIGKLQRRLHYDHHIEPARLDLLFLPPWFGMPLIVGYANLYFFVSGSLDVMLAILAGNLIGLLYYEWVHFVAHIPVTPMTGWGRWMKKYHLLHHFKNEHYWFGVTNPLGDLIAGTFRDKDKTEKSPTTKFLFEEIEEQWRETSARNAAN